METETSEKRGTGESERERETEREMGRSCSDGDGGGGGGGGGCLIWAVASSAQLVAGIISYRRGYNGDSRFMPFKAFAVASLFVGAGATSVAGLLHLSGVHKADDLKVVGANIRSRLGFPPNPSDT